MFTHAVVCTVLLFHLKSSLKNFKINYQNLPLLPGGKYKPTHLSPQQEDLADASHERLRRLLGDAPLYELLGQRRDVNDELVKRVFPMSELHAGGKRQGERVHFHGHEFLAGGVVDR